GSLGHRKDDETGLIYMRARYYDPQVGRFTSEDPARSGRNWYAYASNNPVSRNDPTGLMTGSIDVSLSSPEEVMEKLEGVEVLPNGSGGAARENRRPDVWPPRWCHGLLRRNHHGTQLRCYWSGNDRAKQPEDDLSGHAKQARSDGRRPFGLPVYGSEWRTCILRPFHPDDR
ncbi:MAG: RHS repeat-associated core domain-containing protein, partial [Verrucomicrobiaceae bacterium]